MLKLNNCKKFMKKCTKCNKLKNINEFTIKKDMKDGHRNQCKECCNEVESSITLEELLNNGPMFSG